MAERPLRVAVLSELPTPYRWPLFQRVAAEPDLDVTVLYYSRTESDRDWGLDVAEGGTRPSVEFLPGRAVRVRGRRSLFFHWNPGVAKRLAEGRFDVVVIPGWSMPTSIRAALWCRTHGTPYVVFSETHSLRQRPWWLRAGRRPLVSTVVGGASAWLAAGTLAAEHLAAHGADPARTRRFANTPDVEALAAAVDAERPRRAAVRASLDTPDDAVVVVFVGRLIGAKDAATLLDAWALLEGEDDAPTADDPHRADLRSARRSGSAAGEAPVLWIVGDGPETKSLQDRAARHNLARVRFAGSRRPPELPGIWAAADLFALPSRHEPWGVVVNEAMAAGLPVVLSDRVGAAHDLLAGGAAGRMVPAGDAAGFAGAIAELSRDGDLRSRMGAAARTRAAEWGYAPSVRGFAEAVRLAAEARP